MSCIDDRTSVGRSDARGSIRALMAVVMVSSLVGLAGCSSSAPGSARTTEELLGQLHDDREAIDHASDQMMQRIEIFNSTRKPGEATLQFAELFAQDLSPDQKDILNKMVEQEKDVSYKSLLTKIIDDRNTIRDLQDKLAHAEQSLPDQFVIAKKGDKHRTLALHYLTQEAKLDEARAREVMRQSDQTDELVPGNKVWFLYNPKDDSFRTYVTRGDALQTPVMVRRAQKKELLAERDGARSERDAAQQQAAQKEQERAAIEAEMHTRENSVYYHAASNTSLKESGVLSPITSKIQDVKSIGYDQSVDLRSKTTIDLVPERYGLQQIRSIRVLPSIYQEGRDYRVETTDDYKSARVVLLEPEVFKGKELLLAVSR
ncbi:MAG TPA: hypothetical protein VGS03_18960 [Candidatus Polarisedimenticolia bacterium]|nr:hypothetical protein [Candidatus Polarisedimenticolia bacterium]